MKKFRFFDKATTAFIIVTIVAFHYSIIFSCCRFYQHYSDSARWFLMGLMIFLLIFLDIVLLWSGFFRDVLSYHSIDSQGIHCFSVQWGKYLICWDSIRTYGMFVRIVSYMKTVQVFFSQNPCEKAPQTPKELSVRRKDRIVLNLSPELWEVLEQNMPQDMKKILADALSHNRGAFSKR